MEKWNTSVVMVVQEQKKKVTCCAFLPLLFLGAGLQLYYTKIKGYTHTDAVGYCVSISRVESRFGCCCGEDGPLHRRRSKQPQVVCERWDVCLR
jgi:hypothetical protein